MRWLAWILIVAACDSGKTDAPPPSPAPRSPAVPADAASADPWSAPPESQAPTPSPEPHVPTPPPESHVTDSTYATLVKDLTALKRSTQGPGLCSAPGVDKTCKVDADCAISQVITDQCRTTYRIGVNVSAKAALDARLVDPCAKQNCPSCVVRWMIAEDCGDSGDAVVSCLNGRCTTRNVER